jgi:hypothetical protein
MKEIGEGGCVVVAISDKYLRSEYCMYELYEVFRQSKHEKEELRRKIYPIKVEGIKLSEPSVLATYFEFWREEEKKWADLVTTHGTRISPVQHEHYKRIKLIASDLGDFLDFFGDMNTRTKQDLSKDNFAEIKRAIMAQAKVDGKDPSV